MGETQDFGRWGRPQPVQQFGKGFPHAVTFGGRVPRVVPQQFGGKIPFVDEGWKSPGREAPPASRTFLD